MKRLRKKWAEVKARYQNVKNLSAYIRRHRVLFILSIFCGIFNSLFTLGSLLLAAYLTGLAFGGERPETIAGLLLPLFLLVAGKGIFQYLHMLVCHDVAYRVMEDMRCDLYDAVERGAPLTTLRYRTGDVSSIVMEDVETMEVFLAHMIGDYVIAFVCMILYLALFFFISRPAALLSLAAVLPIALIPYLFGRLNQKRAKALRDGLGQTNAGVVDTVQGLKEIIFFGREQKFIDQIKKETMELNRLEVKDGVTKGFQAGLMNFVMSAVLVGVLVLAHTQVLGGSLKPEQISVVIIMALNVFLPIVTVSGTAGKMNLVAAAADRIYTLLHEPAAVSLKGDEKREVSLEAAGPRDDGADTPLLEVRDLHFHYQADREVLRGLSFRVKRGESLAITGESGVGKTTLINLILRFYDPASGFLKLAGVDLRELTPEAIRAKIAYVPQDVYLFRGTILDNLRLAKPDATLEEVKRACRIALADGFIEALENGYEAFVGERGLTLSGGQKQRVAIARALLTGAPLLIMDEAVSNLDSENEELFRRALKNVMAGRTVLTIAHRRSTLAEAERLLVLKKGRIVFDGAPEDWFARS